jgi:hypothetical protein
VVAVVVVVVDGGTTTAGETTEPDRGSGATGLEAEDDGVPAVPTAPAVVVVIVERGDVPGELNAPEATTADFFNGAMGLPPGMAPYSRTNICSNSSTS